MTTSPRKSLRKNLFKLHKILGLVGGVWLAVVTVTGGLLLFREGLSSPPPVVLATNFGNLTISEICDLAKPMSQGASITDIHIPSTPEDAWILWLDDHNETTLYLDHKGNLVERREGRSQLTRLLFRLHTGDIMGVSGTYLSLLHAVALFALILSGSWMWYLRLRKKNRSAAKG